MIIYTVEEPLRIIHTLSLNSAYIYFEKVKEKVLSEVSEYLEMSGEDCRIEVTIVENYINKNMEELLIEALNNGTIRFEVSKTKETWICPV